MIDFMFTLSILVHDVENPSNQIVSRFNKLSAEKFTSMGLSSGTNLVSKNSTQ
jgi:hypothetical protein